MVLLIRDTSNAPYRHEQIYIPLWFYLYVFPGDWRNDCPEFTFHYGSTYTEQLDEMGAYDRFTFHYGSTYTRIFHYPSCR